MPYGWTDSKHTSAHEYLLQPVRDILRERLRSGASIVDMGCGNGAVSGALAAEGYATCGFDASADGIEIARATWPSLRWVEASVSDERLAGSVGSGFDAAISIEVIEHLYLPRLVFKRASELLRPGGLILISTPYHGYFKNLALAILGAWDRHLTVHWDGGHIKFFSRRTLVAMARQSGFEPVMFQGVGRVPYLWKSMIVGFRLPAR